MKIMAFVLSALALCSVASCIDEDYDSARCAPKVVMLKAVYDRQWEYSEMLNHSYIYNWQDVWPLLGFDCSYNALCPDRPDGLRAIVYDDDDAVDIRNIPASGGLVYLSGDESSILIFNNDTEYNVISDPDDATEVNVRTREMDRPTYEGSKYAPDAKTLTTMPDVLFHCFIPVITWETVNDTIQMTATLEPLVYTYAIRFGFDHGLDYVAIARGALAGMAYGVRLWDGDMIDKRVSVGFDAQITDNAIEAYVNSFGHPIDETATYGLVLELRLKNGTILDFDYDITNQMRNQPFGGVILIDGIEIPDSIGEQPTGGGFDVTVDGWGEFEDIPLDFN